MGKLLVFCLVVLLLRELERGDTENKKGLTIQQEQQANLHDSLPY